MPEKLSKKIRSLFTWDHLRQMIKNVTVIGAGSVIVALGFSLFQLPFNLAAGGITGLSIIIGQFIPLSAGLLYIVMNIPLMVIGYRQLGGWRFLSRTVFSVIIFSVSTDALTYWMPKVLDVYPLTHDMLLSSIYVGLTTGIGSGIIYRSGGTIGGTSIISRIVQRKTGIPLSQVYLYVDGTIILAAALSFGWEIALHAVLVVLIAGMASDFALEGPSVVRTASIIIDDPHDLTHALMTRLNRGVSLWEITGGYTGQKRFMVFCTVNRSQIGDLKQVVSEIAPQAFMVIGDAYQAVGLGFRPMTKAKRIQS